MMPHSIRGKVSSSSEGPRYCVACHNTTSGLAAFGTQYDTLRTAMQSPNFTGLDNTMFNLLQDHIGRNPGNQLNSPLWVHMVAGLGTGLFLFDEDGCPINPLDNDDDRKGCDNGSPADNFDLNRATFNMDRIVDESGVSTGGSNHPINTPMVGPPMRDGAGNVNMTGPLGMTLIQRLTDPNPSIGIVLDSWIDADGVSHGTPGNFSNAGP